MKLSGWRELDYVRIRIAPSNGCRASVTTGACYSCEVVSIASTRSNSPKRPLRDCRGWRRWSTKRKYQTDCCPAGRGDGDRNLASAGESWIPGPFRGGQPDRSAPGGDEMAALLQYVESPLQKGRGFGAVPVLGVVVAALFC